LFGRPVLFATPDSALELLRYIDQHAGGKVAMAEVVVRDQSAKAQYLVNSLIEEAIRSSQLEGAITTRVAAKEMIRTGRTPEDRSERMILNNYHALEYMREEVGQTLTEDAVLTLHRILTEETLDDPDAAGRLQRTDEERVVVWDSTRRTVLHQPPPAEELPRRFALMCRFANGEIGPDRFLHPVVRAILLHFWLAYDHPFEDGNGRTARALFYWSMRTQGYWATEYLSISRIIRQGPSKYLKAFLECETDDGDTTYFILHQLGVIRRAIDEFHTYLQEKMQQAREFESVVGRTDEFNHRQAALLRHALRNPEQRYTFKSHQQSHRVSFESARSDLTRLWKLGLLERRKSGRQFVFIPQRDLADRLTQRDQDARS
jgi:Fic family protein